MIQLTIKAITSVIIECTTQKSQTIKVTVNTSLLNQNKLLRTYPSFFAFLQLPIDCLVTGITFYTLTLDKTDTFSWHYQYPLILSILLILVVYQITGQYKDEKTAFSSFLSRCKAWFIVVFILLFIGFITKSTAYYSREIFTLWIISSLILQHLFFLITKNIYLSFQKKHHKKQHALVIGNSASTKKLIASINKSNWVNHKIIGYVGESKTDGLSAINFLGSLDQIDTIIDDNKISLVYIALPSHQLDQLNPICLELMKKDIDLHWIPDVNAFNLINHHVKEIAGLPVITLSESPLVGSRRLFKRLFDFIFASLSLILFTPFLLLTAILIKLDSPGPVFFRQERHGWNHKVFKIYKFRSMKLHKEESNKVTQATQHDPRITKLGAFLRKSSIDELPQLINVIKGDMSIVGPRPHAIAHNHYYQDKIDGYLGRHKIKPGITGLAQITGFRGETDTHEKMLGRVKQDLAYINNWSIHFDIEIILRTFVSLWRDQAY